MPTTSTERTRKYRANHKDDPAYKQYNRETTNSFRKEHAEEYKKKNAEHNKVYREKLKAKANAINTIANLILARKARNDYIVLKDEAAKNKSYYMRKKEAILTGSPMVLRPRGRKPKY